MSAAAAAAAASDLYHYSTQPHHVHHHHHSPHHQPVNLNCHQLLNNAPDPLDSQQPSPIANKKIVNTKEEITKLKTEPLDATTAAMTSATQQPSFHVRQSGYSFAFVPHIVTHNLSHKS